MEKSAGDIVCNYGEKGDLFYIILDGQVNVRTVSPVELFDCDATSLINFLIINYKNIYWGKIPRSEEIRGLFKKEVERCGLTTDPEYYDPIRVQKALTKHIADGSTIHFMLHHRLNPHRKSSIILQWFKTVATLESGHSFGELALLKGE